MRKLKFLKLLRTRRSSGQVTRTPCAVERDVCGSRCSEVQSELRSGKAHPPTKELFNNNSYARDDQGDNPGQEIEGLTVSCKNCDRSWHLD